MKGIADERRRRGETEVNLRVGIRTGDTPAQERSKLTRNPPDILITTPESLYLMLTSRARETLRGVETVIIDEVHAVAGSKRGAHLALSLSGSMRCSTPQHSELAFLPLCAQPAMWQHFLVAIARLR